MQDNLSYNLEELTVYQETSFLLSGPPRLPTFGGDQAPTNLWEAISKYVTTITLCIS